LRVEPGRTPIRAVPLGRHAVPGVVSSMRACSRPADAKRHRPSVRASAVSPKQALDRGRCRAIDDQQRQTRRNHAEHQLRHARIVYRHPGDLGDDRRQTLELRLRLLAHDPVQQRRGRQQFACLDVTHEGFRVRHRVPVDLSRRVGGQQLAVGQQEARDLRRAPHAAGGLRCQAHHASSSLQCMRRRPVAATPCTSGNAPHPNGA